MPVRRPSRTHVPRALATPVAVSPGFGAPRFWASVYAQRNWSAQAPSTVGKKLHAIEQIYSFATDFYGRDTLDRLLADLATDELDVLLESFFNLQRNRATRSGADVHRSWQTVRKFVVETLRDLAHTPLQQSKSVELASQLQRWELRYRNLSPAPLPKRIYVLRALPACVVEELYSLFKPNSAKNPFRSERQRWRNMAILLCLLHQGLRCGEALLLPVDAIKTGTDERTLLPRYWMNVQNKFEVEDPRYCDPPSIKNAQSNRQIPVSRTVAEYIDTYATNFRGRSPYPQLFLNNRGSPLGVRGLRRIFDRVSTLLSRQAKSALAANLRSTRVSAHDLRHTCAVTRLAHFRAAGKDESESLAQLRSFFGWSYTSEMPRLYARAYWERQIDTVWNDDFDAHTEALRNIAPGGWQ